MMQRNGCTFTYLGNWMIGEAPADIGLDEEVLMLSCKYLQLHAGKHGLFLSPNTIHNRMNAPIKHFFL